MNFVKAIGKLKIITGMLLTSFMLHVWVKGRITLDTFYYLNFKTIRKRHSVLESFFFKLWESKIGLLHINQMGWHWKMVQHLSDVKIWLLFILFLCRGHNLTFLQIVFILKAYNISFTYFPQTKDTSIVFLLSK